MCTCIRCTTSWKRMHDRPTAGHVVSALYPRQACSAIGIHAVKSVAQLCTLLLLPPFWQCVKYEGCTCFFLFISGSCSLVIPWKDACVLGQKDCYYEYYSESVNATFQKRCLFILSTPCVYKPVISLAPTYATCSDTGLNKFSDLHSLGIVGRKMA